MIIVTFVEQGTDEKHETDRCDRIRDKEKENQASTRFAYHRTWIA
jgi:hypothetical protein